MELGFFGSVDVRVDCHLSHHYVYCKIVMKFTKMEVNVELRNLNPGKSYGEQERNVNVEWE
jgi:hypothetical protein